MLTFIIRRILYMIPTMFAISLVVFFIIQLPPGDYLTTLIAAISSQGETVNQEAILALEERYGLDQPWYVQYYYWIRNILLYGDFGNSFEYNRPVTDLIGQRLLFTVLISVGALLLTWAIAFPVGIYSAVRKYTICRLHLHLHRLLRAGHSRIHDRLDPPLCVVQVFDQSVGGLFSSQYVDAPWSIDKFVDLMAHLWIPIAIVGVASTAALIRIMRANLMDELNKPYVTTARAKGLTERRLIMKYPVRMALDPVREHVRFHPARPGFR